MKAKIIGLIVLAGLACLAFPGHSQKTYAQGVAVAQPPVSTNPEIAALQARNAIFEKQLGIINQKLDQLLKAPAPAGPETVAPPRADPGPAPAIVPILRADGTILFNGTVYVPIQTIGSVSATVDACSSAQSAAACASSSSAGVSVGVQRTGLFPGRAARKAARQQRRGAGAAAAGC
jgi:hypothetical protein